MLSNPFSVRHVCPKACSCPGFSLVRLGLPEIAIAACWTSTTTTVNYIYSPPPVPPLVEEVA